MKNLPMTTCNCVPRMAPVGTLEVFSNAMQISDSTAPLDVDAKQTYHLKCLLILRSESIESAENEGTIVFVSQASNNGQKLQR